MTQTELKNRTKKNCISIILYLRTFPKDEEILIISRQLIRSATSIAANYRAACRAKSTADFINKLKIVEEEADETLFWLEIIGDLFGTSKKLDSLMKEANELTAIFTAAGRTIKINRDIRGK
jgi:four helix bundle protein